MRLPSKVSLVAAIELLIGLSARFGKGNNKRKEITLIAKPATKNEKYLRKSFKGSPCFEEC
jgi:hypothetical protein